MKEANDGIDRSIFASSSAGILNNRVEWIVNAYGGGMHISEILGKGVLDRNANIVGKVIDIDINLSPWTINHFIVKMGITKKLTIGVEKVDKIGDKVILKVTKEELGI